MITFGANFTVNNNVYNRLDSKAVETIDKTISGYREFLKYPKIERLTKDDVIELKRAKNTGGYAIELEIKNKNYDEPFIAGIYSNKKEPCDMNLDLRFETLLYLCLRDGEKPGFFETSHSFIKRVYENL